MTTQHQINPVALESVITAEKNNSGAEFTIRSGETGKDYTYKIERSKYKDKWYTHIYVEREYLCFVRIGSYFNGKIWNKGVVSTPAAVAIAWVLSKVEEKKFTLLSEKIHLFHLGCCLRCGKTLTDAQSIEIGLGPVCRS